MEPSAQAYLKNPATQPIRAFLQDPTVTEIMINGPAQIYVEREGVMQKTTARFRNVSELKVLIQVLLQPTGREVSAASPFEDFRLPDGTRGNVILPPLALNGPVVTLRKALGSVATVAELLRRGTLDNRMGHLLIAAIRARGNIVFAGATGTGKTTTLGIFAQYIPDSERIITIEDTAELHFKQPHVVRLECRRANLEGRGEITLANLVKNSLRMRPTRIIVGEIRGDEAVDMIQAIISGHHGCLAVVHAASPEDTIFRLETMLLSRGLLLPLWAIHMQIASAIDLVVQHEMLPDGGRKITRITEVTGVRDDQVALHDLFQYRRHEGGGEWFCDGVKPRIADKCERMGVPLPAEVYAEGTGQ
jgi:pilus assembly protein CpaF